MNIMQVPVDRLRRIRALVLDVDGILTDCRTFLDSSGEWRRFFSIRDGYGMKLLMEAGYELGVITGSNAQDIRERCRSLGITHLYEGKLDKLPAFEELCQKLKLDSSEVAYAGDDLFDLPLLRRAGFAATVPEAMPDVKVAVHWITQWSGGNGAAREICDLVLRYGAHAGGNS